MLGQCLRGGLAQTIQNLLGRQMRRFVNDGFDPFRSHLPWAARPGGQWEFANGRTAASLAHLAARPDGGGNRHPAGRHRLVVRRPPMAQPRTSSPKRGPWLLAPGSLIRRTSQYLQAARSELGKAGVEGVIQPSTLPR